MTDGPFGNGDHRAAERQSYANHKTSALIIVEKAPSANGSRSSDPALTGQALLSAARRQAVESTSRPNMTLSGYASANLARNPPVPQPASNAGRFALLAGVHLHKVSRFLCR